MTSDPRPITEPVIEPGDERGAGRDGYAEPLTSGLGGGWAAEDQVLADHARDAAALHPSPRGTGATASADPPDDPGWVR